MRVKMKQGAVLNRKGGGTESYAAGCVYDVGEETAKALGEDAVPVATPPQPIESYEPNPPPPVLDTVAGTYDEEEEE